ncbi:MAG: hypothetical protein KY457_06335 [Actinobacteria bacterium]|nr:hypothetical protein [Actinomycetota bacterium]
MHPTHPTLARQLAEARQADVARQVAAVRLRAQALPRERARPPSPGRLRLATARTLAAAARRLAPDEPLEDLRHA